MEILADITLALTREQQFLRGRGSLHLGSTCLGDKSCSVAPYQSSRCFSWLTRVSVNGEADLCVAYGEIVNCWVWVQIFQFFYMEYIRVRSSRRRSVYLYFDAETRVRLLISDYKLSLSISIFNILGVSISRFSYTFQENLSEKWTISIHFSDKFSIPNELPTFLKFWKKKRHYLHEYP